MLALKDASGFRFRVDAYTARDSMHIHDLEGEGMSFDQTMTSFCGGVRSEANLNCSTYWVGRFAKPVGRQATCISNAVKPNSASTKPGAAEVQVESGLED